MAAERYENAQYITLLDIITPEMLRTISPEQRGIPLGFSEVPVEFELKKKTAKLLNFEVSWDGMIYGCILNKEGIRKKLGLDNAVTSIAVTDWDGKFLLIFDTKDPQKTTAFYVKQNEVLQLLENCRRIPQQKDK